MLTIRNLPAPRAASAFVLVVIAFAGMAAHTRADEPFPFPKRNDDRVAVQADGSVKVTGKNEKTSTTVLVVEKPKVPSHRYKLVGQIKYEGVKGAGYVEMLNRIPKRGEFFTRTLGASGAMGKIEGTTDLRELELPFLSEPGLLPDRLTVNVVLPGEGTVWLRPLRLVAIPDAKGEK